MPRDAAGICNPRNMKDPMIASPYGVFGAHGTPNRIRRRRWRNEDTKQPTVRIAATRNADARHDQRNVRDAAREQGPAAGHSVRDRPPSDLAIQFRLRRLIRFLQPDLGSNHEGRAFDYRQPDRRAGHQHLCRALDVYPLLEAAFAAPRRFQREHHGAGNPLAGIAIFSERHRRSACSAASSGTKPRARDDTRFSGVRASADRAEQRIDEYVVVLAFSVLRRLVRPP